MWHFLLMLTLFVFYAGQQGAKNCEFLSLHEGCERLSGGLVQGGLASGGARRPGRIQQLIINRSFTFSLYLDINLNPSCCSICSPYVRTFFSLLILFLILLTSPVQLRSSYFICLLMNNVLFFITMRMRVPITCLFIVWFIIKSRAKKSIAKLFISSSGTDWRPLQLPELISLKKVHFTKLPFTLLRC